MNFVVRVGRRLDDGTIPPDLLVISGGPDMQGIVGEPGARIIPILEKKV